MENQLQTIVCPNCGANATNHHNCEYCGSFLVQRAAQGMDVSNYVLDAARFRSSVLEAVLQKYTDFFMKYPDSGLCWELDWNGKTVLALSPASYYSSELGPGYAIDIKSDALQDANAYGRFLNFVSACVNSLTNSPFLYILTLSAFVKASILPRKLACRSPISKDDDSSRKGFSRLMEK